MIEQIYLSYASDHLVAIIAKLPTRIKHPEKQISFLEGLFFFKHQWSNLTIEMIGYAGSYALAVVIYHLQERQNRKYWFYLILRHAYLYQQRWIHGETIRFLWNWGSFKWITLWKSWWVTIPPYSCCLLWFRVHSCFTVRIQTHKRH